MVSATKPIYERPIRIRFTGQYDYDGLLALLRAFFHRHRFDLSETKFKYKTGGSGSEVEFVFKGEKDITHYLRSHMQLEGKIWDMKRKSVVVDGKTKMLTHGRIDFKLTGDWELDFRDKFGTKNVNKFEGSEKLQKKLENKMQQILDSDPEGLQFYDVKTHGKKYMEKTLMAYADEIKTFLGMETMG